MNRFSIVSIICGLFIAILLGKQVFSRQSQTGQTMIAWGGQFLLEPPNTIPVEITNIKLVRISPYLKVVLKKDGTLVAWGVNGKIHTLVGLTDVMDVSVLPKYITHVIGVTIPTSVLIISRNGIISKWEPGYAYTDLGWFNAISLASNAIGHLYLLKKDGTLWRCFLNDQNLMLESEPRANNVKAIASGGSIEYYQNGPPYQLDGVPYCMFISSDGQLYGFTTGYAPSPVMSFGLGKFVGIAAGENHALALREDGTVINAMGSSNIPQDLTDVIAIAAGKNHSLALKKNGTVVAWGSNQYGQLNVPAGLTGVTAIAAGGNQSSVLMLTPVIAQPGSITTPNPAIGPGGVLTITQVLRNTLSIGVTENYSASPPPGFSIVPGSCTSTIGGCVIESPPVASQSNPSLQQRSLANTQSSGQVLNWSGTIPGNGTVTITYQVRVGTQTSGNSQVCLTPTIGGNPGTPTCVIVTPQSGPGNLPLAAGLPQKPGSVLIYNAYTSSVNPALSETQITLTNTNPVDSVAVHLFFVDGATCTVADQAITLTQSQTASFLASDVDPGVTGYLIAVVVDSSGCPTIGNYLIGRSVIRFESGHHASLPAIGVSRLQIQPMTCATDAVTARLNFNGIEYDELPRTLAIDSLPSLATGNSPLLIVNRIGGDLTTGPERLGTMSGLLFDDSEVSRSFMLNGGVCQLRGTIGNSFPRTVPRYTTVVPAGRTGWMKFWTSGDEAITGAMINESTAGLSGGHNLHALTTTSAATLTIPVIPN